MAVVFSTCRFLCLEIILLCILKYYRMMGKLWLLLVLFSWATSVSAQKKEQPVKAYSKEEIRNAEKQAGALFKAENYRIAMSLYQRLVISFVMCL